MGNIIEQMKSRFQRVPDGGFVRKHPAAVLSVILLMILLFQWIHLAKAYQSIQVLDPQIDSLVKGEKADEEKADEKQKPSVEPPEVSQNIFHRSSVSYSFSGMLGEQAIVNGSLVKVGDRVNSATVEEINRDTVKLRTDEGQVRELKAFNTVDMESRPKDKEKTETEEKKPERKWGTGVEWLRKLKGI